MHYITKGNKWLSEESFSQIIALCHLSDTVVRPGSGKIDFLNVKQELRWTGFCPRVDSDNQSHLTFKRLSILIDCLQTPKLKRVWHKNTKKWKTDWITPVHEVFIWAFYLTAIDSKCGL